MQDDKNNIRNEFPIPTLVILEVLHLHILQEIKKLKFHMAAILDLAHTVNRDHLVDKHLGDFSCPGTH